MTYKLNQSDHFISINGILADGDLANSEANIHLDTTSKDIKIKYKDDTGTVRTTIIGDSISLTQGYVAFGAADGSITGVAEFFWDDTDKNLGLGAAPHPSTVLDVISTDAGSRPCPPMTEAQRDAIGTPATGLMVYNTDTNEYNYYTGTGWVNFGSEATTLIADTATGPWAAAQNINLRIGFISDTQVAISVSEATAAATIQSAILITTALPLAFRPASDKTAMIKVADNGANMIGEILISSSGLLTISSSVDNTQFTGSGTTGYKSFSIVYDVSL